MSNELIQSEPESLAENIIRMSKEAGASDVQVKIRDITASYIRFANSEIHQYSQETSREIRLAILIGKKRGVSLIVPNTDNDIRSTIKNVISVTRTNSEDENQLPLYQPGQDYDSINLVDDSFNKWDHNYMAEVVKTVIQSAHDVNSKVINVSGMLQAIHSNNLLMNSENLNLSSEQTEYWYGVDVLAKDGQNTGRNSQGETNRFEKNIRFQELSETAAEYAVLGIKPIKLEPGDYPAVLDYYAVLEPLVFINLGLSGLFVQQHRSFLARKIGQKVFASNFNLKHKPKFPDLTTSKPFDDEGVPTQEFHFIKNGTVDILAHNRLTAHQMKTEPNGCGYESERTSFGIPTATVLEPSETTSFKDLVKTIDNGILISRLFYSNWANPMAGILTGTTRNGFFKIEAGEITNALYPMRHSTSIFEMFGEGMELGSNLHQPPMQMMPGVQSLMTPAVKVPKMHMTTYSN